MLAAVLIADCENTQANAAPRRIFSEITFSLRQVLRNGLIANWEFVESPRLGTSGTGAPPALLSTTRSLRSGAGCHNSFPSSARGEAFFL